MSCFLEKETVEEVREIIMCRQNVCWIAFLFLRHAFMPKSVYQTCSRSWHVRIGDRVIWCACGNYILPTVLQVLDGKSDCPPYPFYRECLVYSALSALEWEFRLTGGAGCSGPRLFFAFSRPCRWTVERMALSPLGKFLVLTTHSLIYKLNIASQRTVPALYVGQPPFQKQLLIYSLFQQARLSLDFSAARMPQGYFAVSDFKDFCPARLRSKTQYSKLLNGFLKVAGLLYAKQI